MMAIAAYPFIKQLRNLYDSGHPEEKRNRHQQRKTHPCKTDTARPPMNPALRGNAMNGGLEIFAFDGGGGALGDRTRERDQRKRVKPIEPTKKPHLEYAHRTFVVVEDHVGVHREETYSGLPRESICNRAMDRMDRMDARLSPFRP